MAKPKPTFCKNCGEDVNCETFNRTGKACRKSKKKVKKHDDYLEQLDELHYEYTHEQDSKVFWTAKKNFIGNFNMQYEVVSSFNVKYISFYRWLKNKNKHTLASWYQRNCNDLVYNYDYEENFEFRRVVEIGDDYYEFDI